MKVYDVTSSPKLAEAIRDEGVRAGFDIATLRDFSVDHSVMVPLHFVNPEMKWPVIPFFIRGHIPPLPPAQRCFDLGKQIRKTLEAYPGEPARRDHRNRQLLARSVRPAHPPGLHRRRAGSRTGCMRFAAISRPARPTALIAAATEDRMQAAGNVGGELLNWIAMLAFTDGRKPDFLDKQMENGHAYAGWRLDTQGG